jgi:hypothetical protein
MKNKLLIKYSIVFEAIERLQPELIGSKIFIGWKQGAHKGQSNVIPCNDTNFHIEGASFVLELHL